MTKVKKTKSAPRGNDSTGVQVTSQSRKSATKTNSKAAAVIALLKRDGGTTLEEMMSATGWQKHSVRGFMAGTLKKRHGFEVTSEKSESGRVYQIVEVQA